MIIKDLKCTNSKCNNIEEKLLRSYLDFNDIKCSKCGSDMKRMVSHAGLIKSNFADKPRVK